VTLATLLRAAELSAYLSALQRHGGNLGHAARELDVHRDTASRAIARLGPVTVDGATYPSLRAWLDAAYPHRNPATVGRRGESRQSRRGPPQGSQ
jgi:hypothetical protein